MDKNNEMSLQERVEQMESVIDELRRTIEEMHTVLVRENLYAPVETVKTASVPETPERGISKVPPIPSQKAPLLPEVSPVTPVSSQSMATGFRPGQSVTGEPPSQPSRTREEWEALIGGKLLNRIGALALIIGIGFFLKYAFDNNWINETMRVLIGLVTGAVLLYGGSRFHKKGLQIFAQGLVGAGIPILYLSIYASFNFYHLVSQTVAFGMMSIVTITAFHQALRYDSFAVSVLGWFGGFLTPFLLSTGEVNEVGLFTYIILLDAGLIAVFIRKKSWAILELLTLLATYITYISWTVSYYTVDDFPVTVVFLTLFWGLFYILEISCILTSVSSYPRIRQAVPALNAGVYYLALYAIVHDAYHGWMAPVTLVLGAWYFLTALWTKRQHVYGESTLARYILTAIALLIIATGIHFSGFMLVVTWSLEALALVWCGTYWSMRYVWKVAIGLFVLSAIRLFFAQFPNGIAGYSPFENFTFILNRRALAFAALSASLGASIFPLKLLDDKIGTEIRNILHYSWTIALFVLCTVEVYDRFSDMVVSRVLLMIALSWMVYSLPMVWSGLRTRTEPVLLCGISSALLAVVFTGILGIITFEPIEDFRLALNIRAVILVALITGTFFHTLWLKNNLKDYTWFPEILGIAKITLVLLIFSLITGETKDFFEKSIVVLRQSTGIKVLDEINRMENLRQLSLSGVWLLYSIVLMGSGMWRRLQGLRIVAIVLFGFTILKIFIYDLSFLDTLYRIFSFIGLGLILMVVSYLYQQYKSVIFAVHSK